ncbi:MAG: hypothetical protein EOM80_06170 [Erysipelotrichia bacterium]|nr:hypothetical protein [Erysipelotrichia bacterium]
MPIVDTITEWLLLKSRASILELGSSRLRWAEGVFVNNRPVFSNFRQLPAPPSVLSSQLGQFVCDTAEMAKALKQLTEQKFIFENYASIVIPDQAFHFGSFWVPAVAAKTGLQPFVEREIQKTSSLPYKEYSVKYEFGEKKDNKIPVHYCALPLGILNEILEICDEAKIVPIAVQPSFAGLVKLLKTSLGESKHPSVFLHIGNESITAGIYGNDGLRAVHIINRGISDLIKIIQTTGKSAEEAQKALTDELVLLEDPTSDAQFEIETYRLIEAALADILQKIYGFLLLFSNDHPDESGFIKIVLSGGGTSIRNLDKLITSNIGIPTVALSRELDMIAADFKSPAHENLETLAPIIGNMLLEPWRFDRYDRIMAA